MNLFYSMMLLIFCDNDIFSSVEMTDCLFHYLFNCKFFEYKSIKVKVKVKFVR